MWQVCDRNKWQGLPDSDFCETTVRKQVIESKDGRGEMRKQSLMYY